MIAGRTNGNGEATPPAEWRELVAAGVDEGQRDCTGRQASGHLLRRFIDPFVVLDLMQCWNATRCRPPLPESRHHHELSNRSATPSCAGGVMRDKTSSIELLAEATSDSGVSIDDFYAYMPMHCYVYAPSREMWPASSVNARIAPIPGPNNKSMPASTWLDQHKPVEQMSWCPGLPMLVRDRLICGRRLDRTPRRELL